MATFWERAVNSVYRCFTCFVYFYFVLFPNFGFEGGTVVLIASVSSHCLSCPNLICDIRTTK